MTAREMLSAGRWSLSEIRTHLWLEISVDVSQFVQLVDTHEHFSRVELGVFLLQDARVVQQRSEVTSRYVFLYDHRTGQRFCSIVSHHFDPYHGEIDMFSILESV